MSAETVIQKFVHNEYGQNIFVDPPTYDPSSKRYFSNIRSKLPVFIHDDRFPQDYQVRVLKIDSLGQIFLNNKMEIIPQLTTYREKCYKNLETLLEHWRNRIENIVVTSSSAEFAKITEFRNYFGKIDLILDNLLEHGKITHYELSKHMPKKERSKLLRYLDLLEGIDLVRKIDEGYLMGNTLIGLSKSYENDEKQLRTAVLSHVIKNRYLTLKQVFDLYILEKTIAVDNVIYLSEIELGAAVHRRQAAIQRGYKHHYKKNINSLHLTRILRRLHRCGAIDRKGEAFFGHDHLREDMITKKENEPPLVISRS